MAEQVMESSFGEYDPSFDETEPGIRQGDVIQLVAPEELNPVGEWAAHLGVVVTANCDLVHGKHHGVVSYVPVVPVEVYLRLLMLPRILEAQAKEAEWQLREALEQADDTPGPDRIVELIHLEEAVIHLFPDTEAGARAQEAAEALSAASRARNSYDPACAFDVAIRGVEDLLIDLKRIRRHKQGAYGEHLRRELKNRLAKSMPGDCLFFAQPAHGFPDGHIAYLRLVRELPHSRIATSAVMEKKLGDGLRARRVGRLNVVYLHRLTQQMAQVFTDIGLPSDYEMTREATLDSRTSVWLETILS